MTLYFSKHAEGRVCIFHGAHPFLPHKENYYHLHHYYN